jgi:hypothetical protein
MQNSRRVRYTRCSMELLLNFLWFAIAAGALLAYLRVPRVDRRQFRLGLGALLCVLTLLLPAISISDDLHFEACAVEDSNSTKRLVSAAVHADLVAPVVGFGIPFIAWLFAALTRTTWRSAESSFQPCPDSRFHRSIPARAPPFLLA